MAAAVEVMAELPTNLEPARIELDPVPKKMAYPDVAWF